MEDGRIVTHVEGNVGYVVLDRPPLNVISTAMARAIVDAVARHDSDPSVKVICLKGHGDAAFAAGSDVGEHEVSQVHDHSGSIFEMVEALIDPCGKLRIAAIHGYCSGGGCEAAFACDLVVAHENVRLALPEIKLGVVSTVAGNLMARRANPAAVLELATTGEWIGAEVASELGLLRRVFPAQTFDANLAQYLALFVRHSGEALRVGRQMMLEAWSRPLLESLAPLKRDILEKATTIPDYAEGVDAFLTKRQPVWTT